VRFLSGPRADCLRHKPVWLPCPAYHGGMEFAVFPADAFSFYEQLRVDNSKAFWIAHKGEYEQYGPQP
jgi:hypothetical protein